jgi:hypothetical protein
MYQDYQLVMVILRNLLQKLSNNAVCAVNKRLIYLYIG